MVSNHNGATTAGAGPSTSVYTFKAINKIGNITKFQSHLKMTSRKPNEEAQSSDKSSSMKFETRKRAPCVLTHRKQEGGQIESFEIISGRNLNI